MKTLTEHNETQCAMWDSLNSNEPVKNGIACPECGQELVDSNPMVGLTSIPPQCNVSCGCGFSGYRVK